MAGYTNLPFRALIRMIAPGVDYTVTELINARSLIERNPEALRLITLSEEDTPCGVQLFGNITQEMAEAARIAEAHGAFFIDINMGCPAPKIFKNGGGAALLTQPELALRLVESVVEAVKIPVTVKMRLGVELGNLIAPSLANAFQETGIQSITIHGRYRSQGFSGDVRMDGIAAVVQEASKIPVFANGDVTTLENARLMLERTEASGLSIGRGALYNPWIFKEIKENSSANPSFQNRLDFMIRHLEMLVELCGEKSACCQFRKIAPFYTRRMGPSREVNRQISQCTSLAQFHQIVEQYSKERLRFLDDAGELKHSYKPQPVHSTLDQHLPKYNLF
jgi:tRNA-dihydrouridine synthase B